MEENKTKAEAEVKTDAVAEDETTSQSETSVETNEAVLSTESAEGKKVSSEDSKVPVKMIAAVLIGIALVAGAFFAKEKFDISGAGVNEQMATELGLTDLPKVVAKVNGVKVSAADYVFSYQQAYNTALYSGANVEDLTVVTRIEEEAMTVLINTKLLGQLARKDGLSVTEEELNAEVSAVEMQFGGKEALLAQLEQVGISEAKLRSDLQEKLLIEKYVATTPEMSEEFTVSEEESKALYDEVAAQNEQVPPYEEVKDQVDQQVLLTKQQEATNALLERVRSDAKIEIFLE